MRNIKLLSFAALAVVTLFSVTGASAQSETKTVTRSVSFENIAPRDNSSDGPFFQASFDIVATKGWGSNYCDVKFRNVKLSSYLNYRYKGVVYNAAHPAFQQFGRLDVANLSTASTYVTVEVKYGAGAKEIKKEEALYSSFVLDGKTIGADFDKDWGYVAVSVVLVSGRYNGRDYAAESAIEKWLRAEEDKKKAQQQQQIAQTGTGTGSGTGSGTGTGAQTGTQQQSSSMQPVGYIPPATTSRPATQSSRPTSRPQTGADGSSEPVFDAAGNSYSATLTSTGETRYFDNVADRDAYMALEQRAIDAKAAAAKAAQQAEFDNFKQSAIAASNVKLAQSQAALDQATADFANAVGSMIAANQARREAKWDRQTQQAAEMLQRAAIDLSNNRNLEGARRTLFDIINNSDYSWTDSATEAYYLLGMIYSTGVGVDIDAAKAASYFDRADDLGMSKAAKKRSEYITTGYLPVMLSDRELTALYNNRSERISSIRSKRTGNLIGNSFVIALTTGMTIGSFVCAGKAKEWLPEDDEVAVRVLLAMAGIGLGVYGCFATYDIVDRTMKNYNRYTDKINSATMERNAIAPYVSIQPVAMNFSSVTLQSNVHTVGLSVALTF